jgi:hypothetical protein
MFSYILLLSRPSIYLFFFLLIYSLFSFVNQQPLDQEKERGLNTKCRRGSNSPSFTLPSPIQHTCTISTVFIFNFLYTIVSQWHHHRLLQQYFSHSFWSSSLPPS